VAGLGTFGLCEGLITPLGKAVRFGSVVAEISIPPTIRPYQEHHDYCLFFTEGSCRECIERCPAGAVTEKGHDKVKCWDYIESVTAEHTKNYFDGAQDGCGFCQTRVPCESGIPLKGSSQKGESQD
jgi:epoxyqueuosine reductase